MLAHSFLESRNSKIAVPYLVHLAEVPVVVVVAAAAAAVVVVD